MEQVVELGRDDTDGFEICLRRREADNLIVHELIVNGAFAMDSVDPTSEMALADLVDPGSERVLVGGLGLGITAGRLLDRCPGAWLEVVELSSALIGWARQSLTPDLARVATSSRVDLVHADIADALSGTTERPWDAILLDVDNGPDFLIHQHNAGLYGHTMLQRAASQLAPDGLLALWCQHRSEPLAQALTELPGRSGIEEVRIEREGRVLDQAIHWLRWPG
ncbi:spermidine synthase [Aestuariimicrobium ganziense]|uniref:spermidine synthase n=1 Tax=Aestuariimicrobium ganziense TaxID=2773677 RepID=UPI001F2658BF|nr:methyltransferase [Aestuariimicrobium ganziense]